MLNPLPGISMKFLFQSLFPAILLHIETKTIVTLFDIQIAEHYWNNLLNICTYWHRLLIDLRKLNYLLQRSAFYFVDEKSLKYFW